MIFDIIQGSNNSRAKVISLNSLENYYVEIEDGEKSKNVKALIATPGFRLAVTAYNSGTSRGLYTTSTDRMFIIVYNKLIEMLADESVVVRGTVNTSTGMCNYCDNGNQILIVDGSNGYIYNLTTNLLTTITAPAFPDNATHCLFTDGYFLVNEGNSGKFWFSASYDGTTWNALSFATAEYSADNLQGIVKTSNGTIWMIGKQSTELWNNVGTADLPWRRISGSVKEVGCIAPYSIASNGVNVFWLGNGQSGYGSIFMGSGYESQKISTPAIEYQIKQLTNIDDATAFTYSDESHSFYIINFGAEITFCFDLTTGQWHTRGTYNSDTGNNIRQFAQSYCFFNSKHYVGSYLNGKVYEMNLDIYDEDSNPIKRVIVTKHVNDENRLLRHKKLEIDFERGIGLVGTAAPQIMVQFSNDGGHTWSSEAWTDASKSAGAIGEFNVRAIWKRLGSARDRVYKISCSDPVKWVIVNAYLEVF